MDEQESIALQEKEFTAYQRQQIPYGEMGIT